MEPLVNDLEDSLVLVCLANIFNNVFAVGAVHSQQLGSLSLVLQLFQQLRLDGLQQVVFPRA